MLLHLHAVVGRQELQALQAATRDARFSDGKLSAGTVAQRVKQNVEIEQQAETLPYLQKIIVGSLYAHAQFRSAVLPHKISAPLFARYSMGMAYGEHIDDPVMGASAARYRADVAITVFLSEPADYSGGELIIRTPFGDQHAKLPAGDAVIYPASSVHRVAPVTEGTRLVAVAWAQSLVRDAHKRELLYELDCARDKLQQTAPDALETTQVQHAYSNLVRMWSEV